jgi:hypothetical protein
VLSPTSFVSSVNSPNASEGDGRLILSVSSRRNSQQHRPRHQACLSSQPSRSRRPLRPAVPLPLPVRQLRRGRQDCRQLAPRHPPNAADHRAVQGRPRPAGNAQPDPPVLWYPAREGRAQQDRDARAGEAGIGAGKEAAVGEVVEGEQARVQRRARRHRPHDRPEPRPFRLPSCQHPQQGRRMLR